VSEALISVDIEASGPIPGRYSMLSIGACPIDDLEDAFYLELQPISLDFLPAALEVSHLEMEQLRSNGTRPDAAMLAFADWLSRFESPIFVGFNAAFDWAFVNHYFIMYFNGANPFGFAPLDIKAYAMGRLRSSWEETRSSSLTRRFGLDRSTSHQALNDARAQAQLLRTLLKASERSI